MVYPLVSLIPSLTSCSRNSLFLLRCGGVGRLLRFDRRKIAPLGSSVGDDASLARNCSWLRVELAHWYAGGRCNRRALSPVSWAASSWSRCHVSAGSTSTFQRSSLTCQVQSCSATQSLPHRHPFASASPNAWTCLKSLERRSVARRSLVFSPCWNWGWCCDRLRLTSINNLE